MIVARYIWTQTQITWLQVIFGNKLLYPVSMSNCHGPECWNFFIYIVDLMLRRTLVVFSMLCASNYHYSKGPPKVEFFKCKTIHSILVHIAVLQSISLQRVINIVLIYIIVRYTCRSIFSAIVRWPTTIMLFLLCFALNCQELCFSHKYWVCSFVVFLNTNFTQQSKKFIKFYFPSTKKCRNQITFTRTNRPLQDRALSWVSW